MSGAEVALRSQEIGSQKNKRETEPYQKEFGWKANCKGDWGARKGDDNCTLWDRMGGGSRTKKLLKTFRKKKKKKASERSPVGITGGQITNRGEGIESRKSWEKFRGLREKEIWRIRRRAGQVVRRRRGAHGVVDVPRRIKRTFMKKRDCV